MVVDSNDGNGIHVRHKSLCYNGHATHAFEKDTNVWLEEHSSKGQGTMVCAVAVNTMVVRVRR